MNISSITTVIFFTECQSCDGRGPYASTRRLALIAAIQEEWIEKMRFNGLEHISLTLCPECAREQEAE